MVRRQGRVTAPYIALYTLAWHVLERDILSLSILLLRLLVAVAVQEEVLW